MSRITKWKLEKMKVKVVFRLQFHATQIPQPGWDKLFVSFIPSDSGKATAKTTKANVRNGTCKWSDPIYETSSLLQDAKTKKYDEKSYKLVVAMGSSRSSVLGEAYINLADYADASKPLSVALPLQGSNSGAVLHVTVQLLTSKTGFREFEQQRELREKGFQKTNDQNLHEDFIGRQPIEMARDHIDKMNARVRFKPEFTELPSLEEEDELNEDNTDSAVGVDGSSHTSESLYAEKHDILSANENDSLRSTMSGELSGHSLGQSIHSEKDDGCGLQPLPQGSNDWIQGWSSDYSIDNELATAYEENSRLRGCLEAAETSIQELKLEVGSLQSHADKLGTETQSLNQQLVAEIASGEELAREVSLMKSEYLRLKDNFVNLTHSKQRKHIPGTGAEFLGRSSPCDQDSPTRVTKCSFDCDLQVDASEKNQKLRDPHLKWQECILLVEAKVREIQSKASFTYHERNMGFLHSDLEILDSFVQGLKKETIQLVSMLNASAVQSGDLMTISPESTLKSEIVVPGMLKGITSEMSLFEGQLSFGLPGQVSSEFHHMDKNLAPGDMMKEKNCELVRELDESKAERENLNRKMDEMERYYEGLIQELEESQRQMLAELQNVRNEHSACPYTINALKGQMEAINEHANEQLLSFAEVRCGLESQNRELEKRASSSETALRRLRLNYSIAVGQLQKDLELLSFQLLSMFETNENLARQAFAEFSQLSFQECADEHPELPRSCLDKDDLQKLFLKEEYKARVQALNAGVLPSKVEELSSQLNRTPVKFPDKMLQNDARIEYVGQLALPQRGILDKEKISHHGDLVAELKKELPDAHMLLEGMKISLQLQEELHQKAEAELSEMHLLNLQLEVFSHALQEILHEKNDMMQLVEVKVDELVQQLESSAKSEEILMAELQAAKHDVEELQKSALNYMTECSGLVTKNHMLEGKLEHISDDNFLLNQKITEHEKLLMECNGYKSLYESCTAEKNKLKNLLDEEKSKKCHLESEISSVLAELERQTFVKHELEKTVSFLQEKLGSLWSCMVSYSENDGLAVADKSFEQQLDERKFEATFFHLEELQRRAYEQTLLLIQENQRIMEERDIALVSLNSTESEVLSMKQKFESDVKDMVIKLDAANAHIKKLQQELDDVSYKFSLSVTAEEKYSVQSLELSSKLVALEAELDMANTHREKLKQELDDVSYKFSLGVLAEEKSAVQNMELSAKLAALEREFQHVTGELAQRMVVINNLNEELQRTKLVVNDMVQENEAVSKSFQDSNRDSARLATELSSLRESFRCSQEELKSEKSSRAQLDATLTDLNCQLNQKHEQMLAFNTQIAELVHFKQRASDLEFELSIVNNHSIQNELCQQAADEEALSLRLQVADLETHTEAMHALLLASDVEITFLKQHFQIRMQELLDQLNSAEKDSADIHPKHQDVVTEMNACLASEAQCRKENIELTRTIQSWRSELEIVVVEKKELADYVDQKSAMLAELEEPKAVVAVSESDDRLHGRRHEIEIELLRISLLNHEEEIDILRSARDELEITVVVLKSKLQELRAHVLLLQQDSDELAKLESENRELACRLSEQMLKTEEFKNLSIHLKELKDKADAESFQTREKREMEGPSAAQESLRIAFIREQCETKVQDLKSQLYVSKKHGEEMLMKLQDALDEVENRKKGEASQAKRNEELSKRILELESELQTVIADKKEKVWAYDRMKAELECSMLSLDCCKEEKTILESSLQLCNEERARIEGELNIMKESLEGSLKANAIKLGNQKHGTPDLPSESNSFITSEHGSHPGGDTENAVTDSGANNMGSLQSSDSILMLSLSQDSLLTDEATDSDLKDALVPSFLEDPMKERFEEEDLQEKNMKLTLNNEHFKEHDLKSSMERLHKELERMKNENLMSLLPQEEYHSVPNFPGLQTELLQLRAANERLGNIFPLFNEFSGSGNALERVLALEIELAEALQTRKKSSIHFQSSFLKQHKDEEAVFQSFRDINELIKDMLEVKRRYTLVETELKEMQERYSQLSLQFAEVEGERQQLVMRLKNVRSPKKT